MAGLDHFDALRRASVAVAGHGDSLKPGRRKAGLEIVRLGDLAHCACSFACRKDDDAAFARLRRQSRGQAGRRMRGCHRGIENSAQESFGACAVHRARLCPVPKRRPRSQPTAACHRMDGAACTNRRNAMKRFDERTRTEIGGAVVGRLVEHLRGRVDVQNIDLMNLAGFCRNCLSNWMKDAADERRVPMSKDESRELVYGMPYEEWKRHYQKEATGE